MIYCNINNRKYKCLFCGKYMTFTDTKDKDSFFTVDINTKLSEVLKNPFFSRITYN